MELASRADCGDRESEWVRDMFTAHMNKEKIAEELLAQTRSATGGIRVRDTTRKRNETQSYNEKNRSEAKQ